LARWDNPALGVEAWESPNVAAPNGKYSTLRGRFDSAVDQLLEITGAGQADKDRIRKLENARKILIEQVLNLDCKVRDLEKKLSMTEDQLRISRRSEADIRNQVIKIKPLKSAKI
jgi:hypothetical protein